MWKVLWKLRAKRSIRVYRCIKIRGEVKRAFCSLAKPAIYSLVVFMTSLRMIHKARSFKHANSSSFPNYKLFVRWRFLFFSTLCPAETSHPLTLHPPETQPDDTNTSRGKSRISNKWKKKSSVNENVWWCSCCSIEMRRETSRIFERKLFRSENFSSESKKKSFESFREFFVFHSVRWKFDIFSISGKLYENLATHWLHRNYYAMTATESIFSTIMLLFCYLTTLSEYFVSWVLWKGWKLCEG